MPAPRVLILRAPGTNCDAETAFAFEKAGAQTNLVHVRALCDSPNLLQEHAILALPGGFSYGDDLGAGRVYAFQLTQFLGETLRRFRDAERLILGVCNGFQVLLHAGLLIQPDEDGPLATLAANERGQFIDRWVHLRVGPNRCPFLTGLTTLHVPVAHGEGRFVCRAEWLARGLDESGQLVLRYADAAGQAGPYPVNPNGSQDDVAGVCDASGRVLGLMPHPERHVLPTQHPQWTRRPLAHEGQALALFRNAVRYFG